MADAVPPLAGAAVPPPDGGSPLPLDGIVVADFSRVLAGPLATMTLADLGADVVKIERPDGGDETRAWGPPWLPTADGTVDTAHDDGAAGPRTSSYFASVNRGKRSVALDLTDPRDLAVAQRLARRADVVVENFRPGLMETFGLGYAQLAAANPRVVMCSVSGFGSGGGRDVPGYDFVVQAVGGLMSITGEADGEPMKVGVALVDVLTGKDAVIGILAALRERDVSGRGQHVEVDLLSSLLAGLVNQAGGTLATGRPPARLGNRHPSIAPYETLRCADGPLAVAVGTDAQFRRFTAALGVPGLADDPRFATNPCRVANRDALAAALEAVLGTAPAAAWQARCTEARIAAGAVGSVADGLAHASGLGLDPTWVPGPGLTPQVRNPVRFSRTPVRPTAAPPALGSTPPSAIDERTSG